MNLSMRGCYENTKDRHVWVVAILSSLICAAAAVGQTSATREDVTAVVHIPYDFWLAGTRLPAGDYSLSPGAASGGVLE